MPSFLLRQILEAGFCGLYQPPPGKPAGQIHHDLDGFIAKQKFDGLDQEAVRVQVCNVLGIPFADQQWVHKCLEGIHANANYFNPTDVSVQLITKSLDSFGEVSFWSFRDKTTGAFIEPVYSFYNPSNYVPVYSLVAAHAIGLAGGVQIDTVAILGDQRDTRTWSINDEEIHSLVSSWLGKNVLAGGQCLTCPVKTCTFNNPFDKMVFDWMKAKAELDKVEAALKEHLSFRGPTKSGAHIVYMKENRRRNLAAKSVEGAVLKLKAACPNETWLQFVKPDAGEIAKAVEKGKLPKEIMNAFSESKYYSLDTKLSL